MSHRFLVMFSLILAGEAIFSLPFHVARFFRATMLDVFAFSNANLGDVFAVYGITAMLAYFPGGAIADRFSARKLLAVSLIATAAGGLYMATIPGFLGMSCLFAYWGVTTILLFWAAMIRATREWGGEMAQGRAFGILDGGRGLVAAGLASIAVVIFSQLFVDGINTNDSGSRETALSSVIYFYTAITFLAALVTWLLVPEVANDPQPERSIRFPECAKCWVSGLSGFKHSSLFARIAATRGSTTTHFMPLKYSACRKWKRPNLPRQTLTYVRWPQLAQVFSPIVLVRVG